MKKIKHYNILGLLGSGGMGEVYKAFDTMLEREVAIKLMHRHLWDDEKTDQRFLQEARAVASLSNPNIVTVYEVGKIKLGRYIVMEYVPGKLLSEAVADETSSSAKFALQIGRQILNGLSAAHKIGLLHRDIKPDNIFITPTEVAKILDFGIAKIMTKEGLTAAGDILGTVEYMPPEQMLGETLDPKCDLYSAGIILYQLLAGRLPFTGDNPVAILYKVLNELPLPPSAYNSEVPPELDQIVLKAIAKERETRWQDADEFGQALDALNDRDIEKSIAVKYGLDLDSEEPGEPGETKVLRPAFVGRDADFKRMVALFTSATRGQGKTLILGGEAGVGKTTMAQRLCEYAQLNKAWILTGACLYQEGLNAYQPFLDALRNFFNEENPALSGKEKNEITELIRAEVPLLSACEEAFGDHLIMCLSEALERNNLDNARLSEVIHRILTILSRMRPCLVMIDDIHWADDASLRLFHYLSHHIKSNQLLLVGITRTERYDLQLDGKPTMMVDLLARLRREGNCEQISLTRFSRENCDKLIDKVLSPGLFTDDFYESMYSETNGNPLFLTETLKLLIENDILHRKEGSWYNRPNNQDVVVPGVVEDVFLSRLNALNEEEREILQVATVIGNEFDPTQVAQLMGITRLKLLKVLQRVETELQILVSTEDGFRFEHPMIKDLLYKEIPRALRREYHLMIVEEIEKGSDSEIGAVVGQVAQHYRKAGEHEKAIPLLYQAAQALFRQTAYREASAYIVDYLDSVEKSGQSELESIANLNLRMKLGKCYEETGRWQESLGAYELLLALNRKKEDVIGQVDALERLGRLQIKTGDLETAFSTYNHCLELAESHDVSGAARRVHNSIGIIHLRKGELELALESFQHTIAMTDGDQDEETRAHALINIGIISNIRGDHEIALESYEKALKTYVLKGDAKNQARVYHNIGMTYADQKEWDRSIQAFERCLQLAERMEDRQLRGLIYLNMGKTYAQHNKLSEAKESVDKALKMFKLMGDTRHVADAYHVFGLIHSARGSFSDAELFFKQCIHLNQQQGYMDGLAEACVAYAELCHEEGYLERALENLEMAKVTYIELKITPKIDSLEKQIIALSEQIGKNHHEINVVKVKPAEVAKAKDKQE